MCRQSSFLKRPGAPLHAIRPPTGDDQCETARTTWTRARCDGRRASRENGAGGSPGQGDSRRDAAVELPEAVWARLLGGLPMSPRRGARRARHAGAGMCPSLFRKLATLDFGVAGRAHRAGRARTTGLVSARGILSRRVMSRVSQAFSGHAACDKRLGLEWGSRVDSPKFGDDLFSVLDSTMSVTATGPQLSESILLRRRKLTMRAYLLSFQNVDMCRSMR